MELRELGGVLRRGWWIVVAGILVGLAAAGVLCLILTPKYESETQFFVSAPDSIGAANALSGGVFSQQRAQSYVSLLTGPDLTSRIIDALDLDLSDEDLADEIDAEADLQSVLIDVTVSDKSKTRALAIAQTIGAEFPKLVTELETAGQGGPAPVSLQVTGRPVLADEQSWPKVWLFLLVGGAAGLVLGFGAAVARARLDRSIKDPEVASDLTGAPVIGTILRDPKLPKRRVSTDLNGGTGEGFRQLRTNLQFLDVDNPPKVIMMSSAVPGEGKTTTAVNLGLALARAGRRVTIVDADLRSPQIAESLGLVEGAGLTNLLAGTASLSEVLQTYGEDGCQVLGSGPIPPNPSELLASASTGSLLDKLRSENDYVIVDSAPLLPVADATGLATHVDGVLLSVRFGKTRTDQLRESSSALRRVGARVLGVVMNAVPPRGDLARAVGYGYPAGEQKQKARKQRVKADSVEDRTEQPAHSAAE